MRTGSVIIVSLLIALVVMVIFFPFIQKLYNAFKRLSKGYSEFERAAMFYGNAVRVYRIDD